MRTSEIIEAVPQSLQEEYNKTMKKLWITAGGMAATTGLFFAGMASPYAGCLGMLWFYSELAGSGYFLWNMKRKAELIETMSGLGVKTTYTTVEQTGNRLLRLLPPGLHRGH